MYARAKVAARNGLSKQALEMLLASNVAAFGREGAEMQLDLLLAAGRAFDAFHLLEPEQEALLGFQKYHMLRACAAAGPKGAAGNWWVFWQSMSMARRRAVPPA